VRDLPLAAPDSLSCEGGCMTDWLLNPYHALGTLAAIGAIWGLVLMIRAERAEDMPNQSYYDATKDVTAKIVHRYPPMTEKAAKGFARDPTLIMKDQIPREDRERFGVARRP
jgi:hypothetical protein